jgi:hypothetical protein
MTLQEFIQKYEGDTVGYPTDSNFYGECLSLVKWYMREVFGFMPPPSGVNSAYGYWTNFPNPLGDYFTKVTNTREAIIYPGDVPVWDSDVGGGAGHISVCTRGGVDDFISLDQNWNGKQAHKVTHNFTNIYGWLHPKETMEMYKGYDLDNKESMRVAVDLLVRVQNGEFVEKVKYDADVAAAYARGVVDGKAQSTVTPTNWEPNGLTVEVTEGRLPIIRKYEA